MLENVHAYKKAAQQKAMQIILATDHVCNIQRKTQKIAENLYNSKIEL